MLLPVHKKPVSRWLIFFTAIFTYQWSNINMVPVPGLKTSGAASWYWQLWGQNLGKAGQSELWAESNPDLDIPYNRSHILYPQRHFPLIFYLSPVNLHGYVLAKEVKRYSFSWQVMRIIHVKPSLIISIILCVSIWLSQLHLSIMGYHSTSCSEIYVK